MLLKGEENMSENEKKDPQDLDFWNLDQYIKKRPSPAAVKPFSKSAVEAVEIETVDINQNQTNITRGSAFSSSAFSKKSEIVGEGTITRFIPPHRDPALAKKYVLFEYTPNNPLIKSVKVCSEKPDEKVFVDTNLFIRERRVILNKKVSEAPYTAYYSYSPRYSQMSRAQLSYYLWWRENTRNGVFLKADESYIILYAYELAATGEGEDKEAALSMLCALVTNYTDKELNPIYRLMIRDIICDFCLVHGLTAPRELMSKLNRQLLSGSFLPEFFIDLSDENRASALEMGISALSMYDYRKSKFYSDSTKQIFKNAMSGAIAALFSDDAAFSAITSFTNGAYGYVTAERRPFSRMVNIVNRSIKLEITYYQLSNIQSSVTDAMRYSENKIREHLGVKNKLNIMGINPHVKAALDAYFDKHYPPKPVIDRRRKNATLREDEPHEYDHFYDAPKVEISPERALEIERESWSTTKILTEAFADSEKDTALNSPTLNAPELVIEPIFDVAPIKQEPKQPQLKAEIAPTTQESAQSTLFSQIKDEIGEIADFITLCKLQRTVEQRKFASSHSLTLDEIADTINECAANVFGDIILEDAGGYYTIIEDYIDQF